MSGRIEKDTDKAQILIVDDSSASLKLMTTLLTNQGYQVRPASSGPLALRSVAIETPDLILLDVKMPDMDGYEVCRQLKADPQTCNIPLIFISGLDDVVNKVKGFAAGGVDYITKPFDSEDLLARIEHTSHCDGSRDSWRSETCNSRKKSASASGPNGCCRTRRRVTVPSWKPLMGIYTFVRGTTGWNL